MSIMYCKLSTKIHQKNVPITLIKYEEYFWLAIPKTTSNPILPLNILLRRQSNR